MRGRLTKMLVIGLAVLTLLLWACAPPPPPGGKPAAKVVAQVPGDANAGKQLFAAKGCIACHTAPGVQGAVGTIGPNLGGLGNPTNRPQLADGEANTPANIRGWVKDPQAKKPGTQMPNLDLSDKEADDLTAFLVTLR